MHNRLSPDQNQIFILNSICTECNDFSQKLFYYFFYREIVFHIRLTIRICGVEVSIFPKRKIACPRRFSERDFSPSHTSRGVPRNLPTSRRLRKIFLRFARLPTRRVACSPASNKLVRKTCTHIPAKAAGTGLGMEGTVETRREAERERREWKRGGGISC